MSRATSCPMTTTMEKRNPGPDATVAKADMNEVLDLLPVPALVISPSNCVQRVSQGLLSEWSRTADDFVGRDLFVALYQGSPTERFDRISLAYAIEEVIAARTPRICHAAYASGNILWSSRIVPVYRGTELLCLVMEWERAKMHINHSNEGEAPNSWLSVDEAFRILVQAVKDYAIFLLDTRGNVATWNAGAELLKGYKKDEIVNKNFSVFYTDKDVKAGKPEQKLETCLREGRVEDQGWRVRKDGSRFWASVVITAVHRNGIHVGFGKVTRDLTKWKEAETRLIAAYEDSRKLKNDFLANMSHEIRTPMHGMLSACSLLLDTPLTPSQRETASIIEESGQVLRQVINDILDYSKLASGGFSISSDNVDVAAIMSSLVRSVQTTLQPGVSLGLVLEPNIPKSARGDPLRFRQIVQNILGNAAKFTETGSITLHASLAGEDEESYTIQTEVIDTGPGVSEKDAKTLFDPFTQVDDTVTKRYKGTGLGLSIARSLTELMGGTIEYRRPTEGPGSIFCFTAKLGKHKDVQPTGQNDDARQDPNIRNTKLPAEINDANVCLGRLREVAVGKRILVAEDNLINRKVLSGILQSFGFEHIAMVHNGAEAIEELANASEPYDLILMDISMPVLDGFQATAEIIKAEDHPPIVAMTAHALRGDREHCLSRGMHDYVPKPVNRIMLAKVLLRWLSPDHGPEMNGVVKSVSHEPPASESTRLRGEPKQFISEPVLLPGSIPSKRRRDCQLG